MDLADKVYDRKGTIEEVREGLARFDLSHQLASDHLALASLYYSQIKRFRERWWQWPVAVWFLAKALHHVHVADRLKIGDYDQIDVATRILSRGLAFDRRRAEKLLQDALNYCPGSESAEMHPHTHCFLMLTMADLENRRGNVRSAQARYNYVYNRLLPQVSSSTVPDRDRQLSRIFRALGFFYHDLGVEPRGLNLLKEAYRLARVVSKDQRLHLESECRKRQIPLSDLA